MKRPLRLPRHEGNELARELRAAGCTLVYSGSTHLLVHHPSGAERTFSATPHSGWTVRRKVRSWLRSLGAKP